MHEIPNEQRSIYLRRLLQRYGTVSLPLGSGLIFSLIQVFQPLRLRERTTDDQQQRAQHDEGEQTGTQEDVSEHVESKDAEETLDVVAENGIEALRKSPHGRLVILGGPGTGKTTVLKYLLCHYAQQALEDRNALLPMFLSLPDLARSGQDVDVYLKQVARDLGLGASTLSRTIQRGQAFICLDSLDEVLPRLRAGIIRQINHLAEQNGNTWIVGSRFTEILSLEAGIEDD